jgi:hypothetical protein
MRLSVLALLVLPLACGDDGAGSNDTGTGSTDTATATDATATDATGSSSGDDSTTAGGDVDPTPILDREPAPSHTCTETRAMTRADGVTFGRTEGLVAIGEQAFALRTTETLALAELDLDGTIGTEVVLEPEEFAFRTPSAVAVDGGIATIWTYGAGAEAQLRYAVHDATLAPVVAPRDLEGLTAAYVTTAATVPSDDGGLALFFGEANGGGDTRLRLAHVDAAGELVGTPVDLAELGQNYGALAASAAPAPDGGYAVTYVSGLLGQGEVWFAVIDADGTPRVEAQRLSRPAGDGWSADFGYAPRSTVLPVGDGWWVAFTETWADPEAMQAHVVVRLAAIDADGHAEAHLLQAPVEGRNNLWPSLFALDDRVGVMWTSGSVIWICGGCIADNDLNLVLLDPDAIVPVSDVVTQLHDTNGIVAPLLAPLPAANGTDLLTASSLDLHAVSLPASGSLHCEPSG